MRFGNGSEKRQGDFPNQIEVFFVANRKINVVENHKSVRPFAVWLHDGVAVPIDKIWCRAVAIFWNHAGLIVFNRKRHFTNFRKQAFHINVNEQAFALGRKLAAEQGTIR